MPKRALDADESRLLAALARRAAPRQIAADDLERLERLVEAGYAAKDPAMKTPTLRLTVRGWAFVRNTLPKPDEQLPEDDD